MQKPSGAAMPPQALEVHDEKQEKPCLPDLR